MYKRIALMALFLLSLSALAKAQDYGSKGRFTKLPLAGAVDDKQQHILDTLQPLVKLSDTLSKQPPTIPFDTPHREKIDGHMKRPAVVLEKPHTSRPDKNALPLPPDNDPLQKYLEEGEGHRTSLPGSKNGKFEAEPAIPGQELKNKMGSVPHIDQLGNNIPDLDRSPDSFIKEAFRDEQVRLIPGKVVPDTVLHLMDSARRLANANNGLLQKEAQLGQNLKKVVFSDKPTFMDRAYLEGIIGLDPLTARIQNLSPALGYYLHPKMSFGLGPSVNLGNPKDALVSAVGSRSFLKYEVIQKKAYLQAENLSHLNKLKDPAYARENAGLGKINHSLYLGAGYLLSISKALSLNVLMLYDLNGKQGATQQASPFNVRLGMSSFKPIE